MLHSSTFLCRQRKAKGNRTQVLDEVSWYPLSNEPQCRTFEVRETLSLIPGCLNSNACKLKEVAVPGCGWTAHEKTRRAVADTMQVLFSLLVKAIDSASLADDIEEKSEAILFQMQYAVSTGQFRISLHGMNSTADRSSFKHLSSNITCIPGFVTSRDRKGCGR